MNNGDVIRSMNNGELAHLFQEIYKIAGLPDASLLDILEYLNKEVADQSVETTSIVTVESSEAETECAVCKAPLCDWAEYCCFCGRKVVLYEDYSE